MAPTPETPVISAYDAGVLTAEGARQVGRVWLFATGRRGMVVVKYLTPAMDCRSVVASKR